MAKTFKTIVELQRHMEKACAVAVKNACERILEVLQVLIDTEYYSQYDPKEYVRTHQFLESATTKMLSKNCGAIFMDADKMDYKAWTGELQLEYANLGLHGSQLIKRPGKFWDSFLEFCEENATAILKEELIKQGIPIIN